MSANAEKPNKLKKGDEQKQTQIGGKGTVRRKKKVVHKNGSANVDKKLQTNLKKLHPVGVVEEINLIKDNGEVIHFKGQLKVASHMASSLFVVAGAQTETMRITDLMPGILDQMGPALMQKMASILRTQGSTSTSPGGTTHVGGVTITELPDDYVDAAGPRDGQLAIEGGEKNGTSEIPEFTGDFEQFIEIAKKAAGTSEIPELSGDFEQFIDTDAPTAPIVTVAAPLPTDSVAASAEKPATQDEEIPEFKGSFDDFASAESKIVETSTIKEDDCGKKIAAIEVSEGIGEESFAKADEDKPQTKGPAKK